MHVTFDSLKTFYNILVQKLKNHRGNWNQNDPTADDYIKNRPFYTSYEQTTIVKEQTVEIEEDNGYIELKHNARNKFIVGKTYTVVFNGVQYECVAWTNGSEACCIGNGDLYGGEGKGDNEPFCCDSYDDLNIYLNVLEKGTYTISISTVQEVVKKLDKKFIDMPDDIVTSEELNNVVTYEELNNVVDNIDNQINNLSSVAFSGNYYDLNNRPTVYTDAVRYSSQTLTNAEKQTARNNIGAGTSNFSGKYTDLTNAPEILQANWEMYNPNSNAYIANKPFGYEYELEDLPLSSTEIEKLCSGTFDENTGLYVTEIIFNRLPQFKTFEDYYFVVNGKPNISKFCQYRVNEYNTSQLYLGVGNASLTWGVDSLGELRDYKLYQEQSGQSWYNVKDTGEDWFLGQRKHPNGTYYTFITRKPNIQITGVHRILSETVNQLDEKYIPDTIARISDIADMQVQSDWNQNDENAADFIKNKPDILTSDILSEKMNATDPVGSGTFSMGRMGGTTIGAASFTHGGGAEASGFHSYAKGLYPIAKGEYSHAEGYRVEATGDYSYAFGDEAIASGKYAYSFGEDTEASSNYSHAEGYHSIATTDKNESVTIAAYGLYSSDFQCAHAEGYGTVACGIGSHTEGLSTKASGEGAHAEGRQTVSSGTSSHAEGYNTTSSGIGSHSEGQRTSASGGNSHAEGLYTTASGTNSHAEGYYTTASGDNSHAEGEYSEAAGENQHVEGKYNALDENNQFVHIIGNGTYSTRSNAHTVDWNGNAWYSGDVYVGSTSGTNKDEGSKKLATEEYVDTSIANLSDFSPDEILNTLNELNAAIANKITVPQNAVAGDLLTYDGTNWVRISRADLIAEIIAALPNAEEATF